MSECKHCGREIRQQNGKAGMCLRCEEIEFDAKRAAYGGERE